MNENSRLNVQDSFLNAVRKAELPVMIYVTNGYLIKNAKVVGFDSFSVLIEYEGKKTLVYKHAISTVTVNDNLEL
jgi:host factor-I protein